VLEDCGATDTQAVQVGGASGICLAAASSSAASPSRTCPPPAPSWSSTNPRHVRGGAQLRPLLRPRELRLLHPCRVGTALVKGLMDKIADGHGSPYDINELTS
jgi:[NiFe] hydrogenase diaphorase moiety large subunit